tara:strand:- start:2077 stop:2559 length:483 start_codon:yes stop_codon:yes gene_type:complete
MNTTIGFNASSPSTEEIEKVLERAEPDDIVKFGLIPEMVGRLPVVVACHKLSKEDLKNILTKPKNAILKQFQKMFKLDGIKLEFSDGATDIVCDIALSKDIGARGLRSVLEKHLLQLQYELPLLKEQGVERIAINETFITENKPPMLMYKEVDNKENGAK